MASKTYVKIFKRQNAGGRRSDAKTKTENEAMGDRNRMNSDCLDIHME